MKLKEWLENLIHDSILSDEHETYLISRGARRDDIERWKIFTWYSSSIPCPSLDWSNTYSSVLEGALVVPIYSIRGDLIGFEWRKGDLRKKIFLKLKETRSVWFGMPYEMGEIWKQRKVWVVEGYMDALVLKRVSSIPVIASGTANLSLAQIQFLERFVDEAKIAFDQDKPGDQGYWGAKKRITRKDLLFKRETYGIRGDDPPKIWDRGGLDLLQKTFS